MNDQECKFKSRSDLVLVVRHVEWAMVDGTPCFGFLTKMAPFPCLFCFDIVWFFHVSDTSIVPDPSTTRYVNSISNGTKTRWYPPFFLFPPPGSRFTPLRPSVHPSPAPRSRERHENTRDATRSEVVSPLQPQWQSHHQLRRWQHKRREHLQTLRCN